MTRPLPARRRGGPARLRTVSLLAACALAVAAERPAAAQATDGLLEALHLKARLAPSPPFVANRETAGTQGFIPAGRTGPARNSRTLTPAELAAATADLDAARERQQRRAGRKPPRVPDKPPRGPEQPKAAAGASGR